MNDSIHLGRLATGAQALVVDGGRLAGIVSPTDVARVLAIADLCAARR